ncbi:MAG TPA: hypothetical protein ENG81_02130 [Candidatus Bathyarchaeota archaeon]|nr:hypothetical protein [Candidatus Bathyarchaeota archaeon]
MKASIFKEVTPNMIITREEIFSLSASIIKAETLNKVIKIIN